MIHNVLLWICDTVLLSFIQLILKIKFKRHIWDIEYLQLKNDLLTYINERVILPIRVYFILTKLHMCKVLQKYNPSKNILIYGSTAIILIAGLGGWFTLIASGIIFLLICVSVFCCRCCCCCCCCCCCWWWFGSIGFVFVYAWITAESLAEGVPEN